MRGNPEGEINAKPKGTVGGGGADRGGEGPGTARTGACLLGDTPPPSVTLATFCYIVTPELADYIMKDIKGIAIR